jgi:hypothetical protein
LAHSFATGETNSLAEETIDLCDLVLHICATLDLAPPAWKIIRRWTFGKVSNPHTLACLASVHIAIT